VDEVSSGIWRVTILSNTNARFTNGSLVGVNVSYLLDVPDGGYAFSVENILLVDDQVNLLEFEELKPIGSPQIVNLGAVVVGNKVDFNVELDTAEEASYYWDFGDGQSGSGKTVSHTYQHAGSFEVAVIVTNLISSETATAMVNVGKRGGSVVITNLQQSADGYPKTVKVTTDPPGLPYKVYYNGSNQVPTQTGTYRVEVSIEHPDYDGTSVAILFVRNWLDSVKEGKVNLGRGWKKVDWFGVLYGGSGDWLYHSDLGWILPRSTEPDSLWMYWPEGDWLWTSRETFPWLYRSADGDIEGGWVYYLEGSVAPNLLFDWNLKEWEKRFE
jgi:PKD repeat protein